MGRPLHKKYFGNRNIGRNGREGIINQDGYDGDGPSEEGVEVSSRFPDGDDGIGGEGVASYGTIVAGSGWTATPSVTFSAPTLPGGVSVAGTAHYKALSATVAVAGTTAYPTGTVVGVTGGSTFTVATLAGTGSLSTVTIGTAADLTFATTTNPIAVGTSILVGGVDTASCGLVPSTYYVSASPAPTATSFTLTSTFADAVAGVNSLGATNAGATTGLTFTYRAGTNPAGVVATVTKTANGDYTTFAATPLATTNTVSATGLTLNVTYGLLSVAVTEQGSGYINPADAAVTFGGSTGAAATAVLTTDTGAVGSATNQENAIIAYVYNDGERQIADIVKQTGSRRYVFITNSDGAGSGKEDEACRGKLVAAEASAPNQADITATDDEGKEYWVTKLTTHKAKLTRKDGTGGYVYDTGAQAPWSFDSTANGRVIIANA